MNAASRNEAENPTKANRGSVRTMQIIFDEEQYPDERLQGFFTQAAESALYRKSIDAALCEISLSFVTRDEIRALNFKYRGNDSPTDVLSFPMYCGAEEIREAGSVSAPVILGDVVICRELAGQQAEDIGQAIEREIVYLFTHSVLHLLGYDHEEETERIVMREAEDKIMAEIYME